MTREEFVKTYHPNWTQKDIDNCYFNGLWHNADYIRAHWNTPDVRITRYELFCAMPFWWIDKQYNEETHGEDGSTYDWLSEYIDEDYMKKFLKADGCQAESKSWEKFWGGDATVYDVAQDAEEIYEKLTGKSAVLWTSNSVKVPTDELTSRTEDYVTCGYTCDYESWGIKWVGIAVDNGCDTVESVLDFLANIGNHPIDNTDGK